MKKRKIGVSPEERLKHLLIILKDNEGASTAWLCKRMNICKNQFNRACKEGKKLKKLVSRKSGYYSYWFTYDCPLKVVPSDKPKQESLSKVDIEERRFTSRADQINSLWKIPGVAA